MKAEELKKLLPQRPDDMHKGNRGRVLIAGGSMRYPGAPALSALGALKSGAGVVTILSLLKVCEACAARLPEVIYCFDDDTFRWKEIALAQKNIDALVIGPGLDRSVAAEIFTSRMWREWRAKILVDGDGLNALAVSRDDLKPRRDSVLTPHEAEAGRLLGITPEQVRADRPGAVRELSERWGCVVLKGHHTLVASGENFAEIPYGGPELSVPGSGDVLSGCIAAFLAGGLNAFDAAVLGASVHGLAGEILAREGVDGVLASEIANTLRKVIHGLRAGK
ncbi:MAG: NAD(P)H-hydrate dehydratase [Synergistaceae bacterium]|nr:NAD(P)H-hydrate dehydratase [Synergistaceae bacterium]